MTANRIRLVRLAALLTAASTLAGLAHAQVPEGHAVICTNTFPGNGYIPGTPGLFLADLAAPPNTPPTPITGLPAELTTPSGGLWGQGAYCVSLRSADGAIIVSTMSGPLAPTAGVIKLWVFHLNGAAVNPARTQQLILGTSPIFGQSFNCVLPDGSILVAAGNANGPLTGGAMAGSSLAIVDTSGPTPIVTPLPTPIVGAGAYFGGMAVAPSGDGIYFVASDARFTSPTNAYVQSYDFATGQVGLVATLPGESAFGIACDDDGTIYVSATNPTTSTHSIYSVVPGNPATVTSVQSSNLLLAWGLDLDRASGRFVAGSSPAPLPGQQFNAVSLIDRVTGASTVVASAPAGGWGTLGILGIAVNNAIESYGPSSDGSNRHWFDNFPNPSGQPTLGNLGFSLTLRSEPGASNLSLMALSFSRGSTITSGIQILVSLATPVTYLFVQPTQTDTYPLPIPNDPGLSGVVINGQSLHLEPNSGLTASRGLSITIQ